MHPLWNGCGLGFAIAAPVGPIGLLVLQQSINRGMTAGLRCGLGAALADLCYGVLAAAGFTLVARWRAPTALIGGLVLLWLAWRAWRLSGPTRQAPGEGFLSTFLLTLSNPMTILSFAALVAGAGAESPALFVTGIFSGSLAWWLLLSTLAGALGARMTVSAHIWLNRGSALVLAAFGLRALSTAAVAFLA